MAETGTRTVERALTLLTAVAQDGGTLSQLARAADLSPSTASRLLAALVSEGRGERERARRVRRPPSQQRPARVAWCTCARWPVPSWSRPPAGPGAPFRAAARR